MVQRRRDAEDSRCDHAVGGRDVQFVKHRVLFIRQGTCEHAIHGVIHIHTPAGSAPVRPLLAFYLRLRENGRSGIRHIGKGRI